MTAKAYFRCHVVTSSRRHAVTSCAVTFVTPATCGLHFSGSVLTAGSFFAVQRMGELAMLLQSR